MTQLNDKSQGNTKVTVINPEGNMDTGFQGNPSSSYLKVHKTKGHGINKAKAPWDISQDNCHLLETVKVKSEDDQSQQDSSSQDHKFLAKIPWQSIPYSLKYFSVNQSGGPPNRSI